MYKLRSTERGTISHGGWRCEMTGSVPAAINSGAEEIPVKFTIELPVKLTKGEKWHVASCPILDVHSQGDTVEEAKSNLTEALTLFFLSCFERGTLDEVLRECGF